MTNEPETDKISMFEMGLKIGERLGVPLLILGIVLFMLDRAGTALYIGAVKPLVHAHTEFLDRTQKTLSEIEVTQRQQAENMTEIVSGQREITTILRTETGARN